jgi:hypothetical protein
VQKLHTPPFPEPPPLSLFPFRPFSVPRRFFLRGLFLCPLSEISGCETAFAQPRLALCIAVLSKSTAHGNVTSPERGRAGETGSLRRSASSFFDRPFQNREGNRLGWCGCGSPLERRAQPQWRHGFGTQWSVKYATVWLTGHPAHRPPSTGVGRELYFELF